MSVLKSVYIKMIFLIILYLLPFISIISQPFFSKTSNFASSSLSVSRLLASEQPLYTIKEQRLVDWKITASWTSKFPPFNFFEGVRGECEIYFRFGRIRSNQRHVDNVYIIFRDPEYLNKKVIVMTIPLQGTFDSKNQIWRGTVDSVSIVLIQGFQVLSWDNNFTVTFSIDSYTSTIISASFFEFYIEQQPHSYRTFDPLLLLLPNILFLVSFLRLQLIAADKFSPLTLLLSVNFLLTVSFAEMIQGIKRIDCREGFLIVDATMTFLCVIALMRRFEDVARRSIAGLKGYLRFYAASFAYLWLLEQYSAQGWFQVVNSLTMIPQIIHNFYYGFRCRFNSPFFWMIVSNQLFLMYYRGIPHNIFLFQPNINVCAAMIGLVILQGFILKGQQKFGSRFFVPKCLIPGYHNYYVYATEGDCAICLGKLTEEPGLEAVVDDKISSQVRISEVGLESASNLELVGQVPQTKRKIMQTPCRHRFHIECLQNWMEYKFQCPIDRSALPAIQ